MDKDIDQKKRAKKSIPLTLETIEKIHGAGPSYQDYIDNLSQEDLVKHTKKYAATKENSTLGLGYEGIKVPDFDWLDLNLAQVKALTDDELQKLLSGEGHKGGIRDSTIQLISNEVLIRQIRESSKPHWTVTPTFIVGCIASLLAAISILVTIYFSVFYKADNNNNHTDQSYAIEKNSSPK